jgi:hypothetical protein
MPDGTVNFIRKRNRQHCFKKHLPTFYHVIIKTSVKGKVEFITNDDIRNSCIRFIANYEEILEQHSQRVVTKPNFMPETNTTTIANLPTVPSPYRWGSPYNPFPKR